MADKEQKLKVPSQSPIKEYKFAKERERDRKPVKGIFRFYEVPGGSMSFVFKEYEGEPVARFDLVDGDMYTLPLGVAKHLNQRGWYPIHTHAIDENGKASIRIGKKKRRFSFQSLEFIDVDEMVMPDKEIITVEHVSK